MPYQEERGEYSLREELLGLPAVGFSERSFFPGDGMPEELINCLAIRFSSGDNTGELVLEFYNYSIIDCNFNLKYAEGYILTEENTVLKSPGVYRAALKFKCGEGKDRELYLTFERAELRSVF